MTSSIISDLNEQFKALIEEISAYEAVISDSAAKAALGHLKNRVTVMRNELVLAHLSPVEKNGQNESKLTPRECEILKRVMEGDTNKEIAYFLSISPRTVQFHLNSIFNKTMTNTRTGAVTVALKNGWL